MIAVALALLAASPQGSAGTLVAGQDLSRRLGDIDQPQQGGIGQPPAQTGSIVFRPRSATAPKTAQKPRSTGATTADRDDAIACERYWFGRSSEMKRIIADGKDPCDLIRR